MSLTCHEEIGRLGRVELVEFGERHNTRTNRQHYIHLYTSTDRRKRVAS